MTKLKTVCKSTEEVFQATETLDKAKLCPLKIIDGGVDKDVDNYAGVYNVSKGKFCAAVVKHYTVIQHKEYFDGFAEALNRLNIPFTMNISVSGNRAFADIEFIGRNLKYDKLGEEFTTGIRLVNSYDKSTGLYAAPRFTRLACSNGMILSRHEKIVSVKHHSKIVREMEGFIEVRLNEIISMDAELNKWVSSSMKDSIEWHTACMILEKLYKQIKHREEILKRLEISCVIIEDKKTKKKSVSYVIENKKKKKFTRWEIYNAITNYLTNGEHITPHIEQLFHKNAERLLTTPLEKLPIAKAVLKT